jgi:hypothetical protein
MVLASHISYSVPVYTGAKNHPGNSELPPATWSLIGPFTVKPMCNRYTDLDVTLREHARDLLCMQLCYVVCLSHQPLTAYETVTWAWLQ